jgi:hypothetical protein
MTIVPDDLTNAPVANSISAVSWGAILAGALSASAASVVLLTLGSGLGIAAAAPFGRAPSAATFGAMIGAWLVATAWIASGIGGYLTGRLRTRWHGTHPHEVFFRDTAHGFLAWALATLVASVVIGPAIAAAAGAPAAAAGVDPEAVRKAAAAFSIVSALAMVVGAFIAAVAAAIGGHERDLHP